MMPYVPQLHHPQVARESPPEATPRASKLLVVSNRLPVSLKKDSAGNWQCPMSSGGLVAALSGLPRDSFMWIGWAGISVCKEEEESVKSVLKKHGCIPVFLPEKIADEHYNGFSNGILWPLFHYIDDLEFDESLYSSYVCANQLFADVIEKVWQPGDPIWIHDIHLMLLPKMLRRLLPQEPERPRIGFFLHIPFPASEIFQVLPWKREILQGMLESDLIGFHTHDYASHFLRSCTRVMGLETKPQGVIVKKDHFVPVGIFPIGIEPEKFIEQLTLPEVQDRIAELRKTFAGKKLIIGVDRMDYIKGIPHKLLGVEALLKNHPEWRGKVVLLQVAVPSRQDVPEYQKLKREIEQLVGHINGSYGSLLENYTPIEYLFRSVDSKELTALYTVADICLVTSLRDGMNLVSLEYVACQSNNKDSPEGPGVLVLSEFAGAAQSLCGGCVIVNPWNQEELCESLHTSLQMGAEDRKQKHALLFQYVMKYTARYWGEVFVSELSKSTPLEPTSTNPFSPRTPSPFVSIATNPLSPHILSRSLSPFHLPQKPTHRSIVNSFNASKKRLIILEYDGVLVPFASIPSLSRPPRKLMANLRSMASDPNTSVYVISGRDRKTLDQWFPANFHIGVCAEQGFYVRKPSDTWEQLIPQADMTWKDVVRPILKHYTVRTPGTFVEETEVQLVWHHRNAEEPFGSRQGRDLHLVLDELPVSLDVRDKRLGVKPLNVTPAVAFRKVFMDTKEDLDFLLVVGNFAIDTVDPLDFPERSYVFGVEYTADGTRWSMADSEEVNDLLEQMVNLKS